MNLRLWLLYIFNRKNYVKNLMRFNIEDLEEVKEQIRYLEQGNGD